MSITKSTGRSLNQGVPRPHSLVFQTSFRFFSLPTRLMPTLSEIATPPVHNPLHRCTYQESRFIRDFSSSWLKSSLPMISLHNQDFKILVICERNYIKLQCTSPKLLKSKIEIEKPSFRIYVNFKRKAPDIFLD